MQETQILSLGGEDPLEKEITTQSSVLAWIIPWAEKPGGSQRAGHDWASKQVATTAAAVTANDTSMITAAVTVTTAAHRYMAVTYYERGIPLSCLIFTVGILLKNHLTNKAPKG